MDYTLLIFGFTSTNLLYMFLDILDEKNIEYLEHDFMDTTKYFKVDVYPKNEIEIDFIYENIPPEYLEF